VKLDRSRRRDRYAALPNHVDAPADLSFVHDVIPGGGQLAVALGQDRPQVGGVVREERAATKDKNRGLVGLFGWRMLRGMSGKEVS
jgi:hypothetical protein